MEVCLSVSSSSSWGESSDVVNHHPPHIYGRLVPTIATKRRLEEKGVGMVDVLDSTRVRRPPPENKDFSALVKGGGGGGGGVAVGASSVLSLQQPSVASAVAAGGNKGAEDGEQKAATAAGEGGEEGEERREEEVDGSDPPAAATAGELVLDIPFCCQRNWCSHSLLLPPGEYILSAYSEEFHASQPGVVNGMAVSKVPSAKASQAEKEATGDTPRQIFKDDVGVRRGVWAHVTSIGAFSLSGLTVADMQENRELLDGTPLSEMKEQGLPVEEVWPFLSDQQHATGSKGLIDVITRVRREVDELNLQILELKYGDTVSYEIEDD